MRTLPFLLLGLLAATAACSSDDQGTPAVDSGGADSTDDAAADAATDTSSPDAPAQPDASPDAGPTADIAASLPGQIVIDFDVQAGHLVVLSHGAWGSPTEAQVTISQGDVGKTLQPLVTYTVVSSFTDKDLHVRADATNAYFTTVTSGTPQLLHCALSGCASPDVFLDPYYTSAEEHPFAVSADGVYVAARPGGNPPYQIERLDKVSKAATSIYTMTGGHIVDSIEDNGTSLLARADSNFAANNADRPVLVSARAAASSPTELINQIATNFWSPQLGKTVAYAFDQGKVLSCALAGCASAPTTLFTATGGKVVTSLYTDRGTPEHLVMTMTALVNGAVPTANVPFSVCEAAQCASTLSTLPGEVYDAGPFTGVRFDGGYAYWVDVRYTSTKVLGREDVLRAKLP